MFDPLPCLLLVKPFQPCKVDKVFADFHFPVHAFLFGHVTYLMTEQPGIALTIETDPTCIGCYDVRDYSDKSGLTCSVWAKKSVQGTGRHFKTYAGQGLDFRE